MSPLNFGILLTPVQALDIIGPFDILNSSSATSFKLAETWGLGTFHLSKPPPDFVFHFIGEDMSPVTLFGGVKIVPTITVDDCPELEYLLVGGSNPAEYQLTKGFKKMIQDHVARGKTLFSTCTGAWTLAEAGVLDGKKATMNHMFVRKGQEVYPKVDWKVDAQWVNDGQIWTAGGAVAGMDMVANWLVQDFGVDIAIYGLQGLDFEPRDINGDANVVIPKQRGAGKSEKATWI
jgi:transcriptional regulator GlxA family with amidase domain